MPYAPEVTPAWRATNTTPTQRMKKIIITWSLLLSAVFSSQAATTGNYSGYYTQYKNGAFWVDVTQMGNTTVSNGLGIWDGSGTGGAGVVSESMGYAMILSALYNDKATFDKLSATIQAGIPYGTSNGSPTGLFPWSWQSTTSNTTFIAANGLSSNPYDSASDGDINIALGYIYADKARNKYGWSEYSGSFTYAQMASKYIAAIRTKDFTSASDQSDANKHILCGGADLAISGWTTGGQTWHPDYSDIRAYQIFSQYDTSCASFWQSAITYTKASWKAIFAFGSGDTRTTWSTQPPTNGDIDAANKNIWISNASYTMSAFSTDYTQVKGTRSWYAYDADASRMPIRVLNYVNASVNSDLDMVGMASALLTGFGTSYKQSIWDSYDQNGYVATYKDSDYTVLAANISIWIHSSNASQSLNSSYGLNSLYGNYTQDFTGAGLLALASNPALTPFSGAPDKQTVYDKINAALGSDGTARTNRPGDNDFQKTDKGFNCSLTLWGLTVNKNSGNDLQRFMETFDVNSNSSGSTTPASITSGSTVAEVKAIVSSRIQTALAAPGSAPKRSLTDTAAILGVSKSNLSKALNLAPTGVKASNGKVNLSKFSKFISRNSKAATLLAGKFKAKGKKTSAK